MNDEFPHLPRFLRMGVRHPRQSLLLILLLSLAAMVGALRLNIDTSLDRLIRQDGIDRQAYLHVAREFGSDQRSFIYLRDEQLWSPEKLAALEQLHEALRRLPFVERIDDLFTAPAVKALDGQLYAHPLLLAAPTDEPAAARARQAAITNPLAVRNIVSDDGKAIAIGISIREKYVGSDVAEVGESLEKILGPARTKFSTVMHIGPSPIEAAMRQGLQHDLRVVLPAAGLATAIVVALICGSLTAAAVTLAVGGLTLLWTFGMMGFAGIPLTLLTATLPPLILVMVTIQIVRMSYSGTFDKPAASDHVELPDRRQRNEFMAGNFGMPFLATVAAATLGCALNVFSDIRPIRDFGVVAAFAMFASGFLSLLLLPALYALFGARPMSFRQLPVIDGFAQQVSGVVGMLRHRAMTWTILLAAVACGTVVQQADSLLITSEPLAFFRPNHPLVQTADRMHEDLTGANVFYITLDANADGAFRDPANLKRLSDIQAFIAKQQVFDRSFSLADLVAQANQEAAGGRPDAYAIPPSRKLIGQYLLLYPRAALEAYVSHDQRRANIAVRHSVRESSRLNRNLRELRQVAAGYAGPTMVTTIVGENLLINAAADRLLADLAKVSAAILVLVFIAVSLMYTSLKGGFIALVPSVLPMLVVLGGMRILEIPASTTTVLIAIIIICVAIDGTLHLFSRYSELCRHSHDYHQAVVETLKHEAAPMTAISLALAASCGVLAFSDFALIAQFGSLAAAAMMVALVANLVVTPLVMSRIRLVGLYEILAMAMQREALVNSPLFRGMSNYQIRKTILISELGKYQDGELLIEQGTRGRSMFLVVAGQIEVLRRDDAGGRRHALLGPGDVFGEIGFVNSTLRTADVRAMGPVSVLRFDYDRLENDLMFFPHIMAKLNFNISGILGRRLAEVVEEYQPPPPTPAPAVGSSAAET
ncbi:MAG: MMPL family transporter [Rhodocyclales bacterium]|nr:MMPL family transporter [Rhodocyclales bacterium]